MKKRFRYNDPSSRTLLQKAKPVVWFFLAWNAFAFAGWRFLSSRNRQTDPEWDSKSEAEKLVQIYGIDKVEVKKVSLFSMAKGDKSKVESSIDA